MQLILCFGTFLSGPDGLGGCRAVWAVRVPQTLFLVLRQVREVAVVQLGDRRDRRACQELRAAHARAAAGIDALYDVASSVVLDDWNPHKWELAMRINKKGRFKYLRVDDWYKFGRSVGVSTDMIRATTLDFVDRIGDVLADAATVFADNPECRVFADRFRDAVVGHAMGIELSGVSR